MKERVTSLRHARVAGGPAALNRMRGAIGWGTLLLALGLWGAACTKKASDEIDFGSIQNSIYENKYLRFTIALPKDWHAQDQKAQQRIMASGNKLVAGDDRNLKAALKASELQTVSLFALFKYPPGSPVPHNPALMGVAERVRQWPGIQRGKDYLFQARKILEAGQLDFTFPKEVYSVQLNGTDFDVMELALAVGPTTVKEKYYATIRKDYALSFIASYVDQAEDEFERKVLETIQFK